MEIKEIAKGFQSLGSEPRLLVYFTLIKKLPNGLNITELQNILEMKRLNLVLLLWSLCCFAQGREYHVSVKGNVIICITNLTTRRKIILFVRTLTRCCHRG